MKKSALIFLFFMLSHAEASSQEEKIVEVENNLEVADPEVETSSVNSIEEIMKFRDPFKGPDLRGIGLAGESINALENFPTSDFKLLGVITGPKKLKAMLLAPDGKTYFVKVLDKIGVREGRIQKILEDRLIIKEKIINLLGKEEQIFTAILMDTDRSEDIISE